MCDVKQVGADGKGGRVVVRFNGRREQEGVKGKTSSRERECNKRPALLERKTHKKRETRRNSKRVEKRVSAVES